MIRDNCGDHRLIDMSTQYRGEDNPSDNITFKPDKSLHLISSYKVSGEPFKSVYKPVDTGYRVIRIS